MVRFHDNLHPPAMNSPTRSSAVLSLASLLLLLSCGGGGDGPIAPPPPPPPPTVATIEIQGVPSRLEMGDAIQLSVISRDAAGTQIANPRLGWTSSLPTVATVSGTGRVTGVSPGQTIIRAIGDHVSGEAVVTVSAPTPTAVSLLPASVGLAAGESVQLIAAVHGDHGVIPGLPITFLSSNPSVASVDLTGKVTALANGRVTISARSGSLTQTTGVTVSSATLDLQLGKLDLIQVAQTIDGDVPMVQGKPTAIRLYPVANQNGISGVAIDVRLTRSGGTLFQRRIVTGAVPTSFAPQLDQRALYLPLPPGLDYNGATLSATIDPEDLVSESDEFDNSWPSSRDPVYTVSAEPLFPIRIRLVPLAPAGRPLPTVSQSDAASLVAFIQLIYPTAAVTVSVGGGINTTAADWNSSLAVSQALNQLSAQRIQDGSSAFYYGVTDGAPINGAAGWGQLSGRASMGWADPQIVAHEVGHNFGLAHPNGCGNGAPGAPGAVIGLPGYDPRTEREVPSSAVSVMSYCSGYVWIQPTAYRTILLDRRMATSLQSVKIAPAGISQAVLITGQIMPNAQVQLEDLRSLAATQGESPDHGPVEVSFLDDQEGVLMTWHLEAQGVMDERAEGISGLRGFIGVIPVPSRLAERVRAVVLRVEGATTRRTFRVHH